MPIYLDTTTHTYSDRPPAQVSTSAPNLKDPPFKGPNTLFKTADAAATDSLGYARSLAPQFVEYGGWIVKTKTDDGKDAFTYREVFGPNSRATSAPHSTPGSVQMGPPPEGAVATFHTHPRRGAESFVDGSQEFFSQGDVDTAHWDMQHGVSPASAYLGTPYGRVRRYDPKSDKSVTLIGPRLPGEGHGGSG